MLDTQFVSDSNNLVLLSGGADSTALLYLMYELGKVDQVLHFNHQLRAEESQVDQLFCESLCKKLNLPLRVIALDLESERKANEGDEAVARRLRLAQLEKNFSAYNIYLAHHFDDLEESFLMRAYRGANSGSLCALRKFTQLGSLKLYRPLLDAKRKDIQVYLKENNFTWREDSSNADAEYCQRNFLRHSVIPQMKGLGEGLNHTLKNLQAEDNYLQEQARLELAKGFDASLVLSLHPALLPRVIRLWFKQLGIHYIASASCLERLVSECRNLPESYKDFPLQEGHVLRVWKDGDIERVSFTCEKLVHWDIGKQSEILFGSYRFYTSQSEGEFFLRAALSKPLLIRSVMPGDKITAFGRSKPSVVSNFLSDAKIDMKERKQYPVLCYEGEIILIPGVRRSSFAPRVKNKDEIGIAFEKI